MLSFRCTIKVAAVLCGLVAAIVGYMAYMREPGLTVFVENLEKRAAFKACLIKAGVQFDELPNRSFKAKPGSVERLEKLWSETDPEKLPSPEFCEKMRGLPSRY